VFVRAHDTWSLEEQPIPDGAPPPSLGGTLSQPAHGARQLLLAAGLVLIALNLRIGVASVGPVLGDIRSSLGLSATAASLLTTIPVFAFGAFAFCTPALIGRIGMHRLLGITVLALAAGITLRLQAGLLPLFAGTAIVGAAIAIGNVVMPPAIKQDFSDQAGLMMGLYSTALFVGAAAASGLTVPLMHAAGGSWRASLAVWALPALLAAVVWIPQVRRRRTGREKTATAACDDSEPSLRSILTDPTAIAVSALMGLQSIGYYATLTWVPTILQDAGMPAATSGWMLSYSAFPGIVASLTVPSLAARIRPSWSPIAAATVLTALAYLGLATCPLGSPYLWMTLLGLGQGASISLSLAYIVWRSPDTHHTGHLSTMAQGFGYLLAGVGPLGIGMVHTLTGSWTVPLSVLGVLLGVQLAAGTFASRPVHIRAGAATERSAAWPEGQLVNRC